MQQNQPGHAGTDVATLPPLPRGLDQNMVEYFHKVVDDKITSAVNNLQIRAVDPDSERRHRNEKIAIGLGAFALGVGVVWAVRKLRGTDDYDDSDDDMGE